MAEIRYEHVSKSFDANKVVDDFDLRIADDAAGNIGFRYVRTY